MLRYHEQQDRILRVEPVKNPKFYHFERSENFCICYYTIISKISPHGRNDIFLISDLLGNHHLVSIIFELIYYFESFFVDLSVRFALN